MTAEDTTTTDAPNDSKGNAQKGGKEFAPVTTQEEFDRRLSERLARERDKFADYADLKAKAAAHDRALEEAMSDAEKAVAAARREGEQAATERSNARLVSAEARALAAEAKFRNPGLAVRALDLAGVTVNDAGEPDAVAIKAKLKELSDADPYLVDAGEKAKPKPDGAQGGTGGESVSSVANGRSLWESRHTKKTSA